jgi:hypothetical protein
LSSGERPDFIWENISWYQRKARTGSRFVNQWVIDMRFSKSRYNLGRYLATYFQQGIPKA